MRGNSLEERLINDFEQTPQPVALPREQAATAAAQEAAPVAEQEAASVRLTLYSLT